MAITMIDSCGDHLTPSGSGAISLKWSTVLSATVVDNEQEHPGYAYKLSSGGSMETRSWFENGHVLDVGSQIYSGWRYKVDSSPFPTKILCQMFFGPSSFWRVHVNDEGQLEFINQDGVGQNAFVELGSGWNYIEVAGSGGPTRHFELRINGKQVMYEEYFVPFANIGQTGFYIGNITSAGSALIDDFYLVLAGVGGVQLAQSFLGPGYVSRLRTRLDGDSTDWTPVPPSATPHVHLQEEPPDLDTSYLESTSVDDKQLHYHEFLPWNDDVAIRCVQLCSLLTGSDSVRAIRKDGGGGETPLNYNSGGAPELAWDLDDPNSTAQYSITYFYAMANYEAQAQLYPIDHILASDVNGAQFGELMV